MKRDSIAEEIIRYFESHPDAEDSLEGIASWWLLDDPRKSVKTVARAIQRLTSEGVLEGVAQPDGATIYRRRRAV
jgi:Fe2+ or Zn2+ uptake regulation protein